MKKIILIALLVTVAMGTAFAQRKQKLGEDAAKRLLERAYNSDVSDRDVKDAVQIISKYAKDAKNGTGLSFSWPQGMKPNVKSAKIKQLFDLLDAGTGIIDKVSTISEAWNLAWEYKYLYLGLENAPKGGAAVKAATGSLSPFFILPFPYKI